MTISNKNRPQSSWFKIKARAYGAEVQIYDEIGGWGVSANDFKNQLEALGEVDRIDLHIHSPGGDVFEGTAIYNILMSHPAKVEVYVDGLAASMASVIAMAGDVVYMPENALMMVHKPWGAQMGEADDFRRYADLLDKVEETLVLSYAIKTGKSEEEIKTLLAAETWFTGAEAVEAGFADQLIQPLAAAAALKSKRMKEFDAMPKQVEELMQTEKTAPTAAAPVVENKVDLKAVENQRRDQIKNVFDQFSESHGDLMNECLLDMDCSAEAAKDKLLAAVAKGTTPTARQDVGAFAGNGNIIGDSIKNSVASRIGIEAAEKGNNLAGMTLTELARASLTERGVSVSGMDRLSMVGMAFTHSTSDFGSLLADVAHKSMLKGYGEAEETFQRWTTRGTLTDFRPASRVDLSTFPSLGKVPEGAEYKHASVSDRGEQIMLATYGNLFSITRQAIINDDLDALSRVPRLMGRAAIRTVGDLVYAILSANPKMADGKPLFHNDHDNLLSAGALSVGRIDKAKTKMMTQRDGDATLNVRPAFMLTPVSLESTAKALLSAEYDPALAEARVPNPVRGIMDVIADARLDLSNAKDTFMVANPAMFDTIEVAYLDGNDSPYIEQQQGFTVDGATFKVRMDAGVAPLSFRTMLKMVGQ